MNEGENDKTKRQEQPGARLVMDVATDDGVETPENGRSRRAKRSMTPELQAHIGRHLRAVFDEVAREPVPDRFLQLLKDLEKSGAK